MSTLLLAAFALLSPARAEAAVPASSVVSVRILTQEGGVPQLPQISQAPEVRADDPPELAAAPVPEAATLLLVGTGLVGIALASRRRWRRVVVRDA